MATPGLRPRSAGEILDGAFTLYRQRFGLLLLTAIVCGLPGLFVSSAGFPWVGMAVGLAASFVRWGALTWMAAELVLGRPVEMAPALRFGLRRTPALSAAVLGVGVLVLLATLAGFLLASVLVAGARGIGAPPVVMGVVLGVSVGVLLAPGSLLLVRYFAFSQLVLLAGERQFLKRSRELSHGAFWRIGLVWSVGWLIVLLPSLLLGVGAGTAGMDPRGTGVAIEVVIPALTVLLSAVTDPFSAALGVLLYYDQRVRKDGLDVEMAISALEVRTPGADPAAA